MLKSLYGGIQTSHQTPEVSAVGGSFAPQDGLIAQQVSFFSSIWKQLQKNKIQNTGWSLINKAVVVNKKIKKMCQLIWTTQ